MGKLVIKGLNNITKDAPQDMDTLKEVDEAIDALTLRVAGLEGKCDDIAVGDMTSIKGRLDALESAE